MTYIPGGGGGSGSVGTSSDVALSNPTSGEVLSYDASTAKWKNVNSTVVPIKVETAGRTLDASDQGAYIYAEGSVNKTYTMPLIANGAPPVGSTITLRRSDNAGTLTVVASTTDYTVQAFHPLNKGNTFSVPENGAITLVHFRPNAWAVEGVYV